MVGYDFDTEEWFNFDGGTNGSVRSIQKVNDYLLVTGDFTMAGDIPVNHAAVWSLTDNVWQDATDWVDVPVVEIPSEVALSQNYPNPFNPTTTIRYTVYQNTHVTLEVHDVLGRRVATLVNEMNAPGEHTVNFNAAGLASGLYIYTLTTENSRVSGKMIYSR